MCMIVESEPRIVVLKDIDGEAAGLAALISSGYYTTILKVDALCLEVEFLIEFLRIFYFF